jgi:hypothetical protein
MSSWRYSWREEELSPNGGFKRRRRAAASSGGDGFERRSLGLARAEEAGARGGNGEERTRCGGGGFERRRLGLARARAGEMGKRRTRSAGRSIIWLSVKYVWLIMHNMRHTYLTLSQITLRPAERVHGRARPLSLGSQ